jgi:steroid delta-isomerase-like uncharacterized protein
MSTEDNKATVRRGFEAVWHQKNVGNAEGHLSTDFVNHDPSMTMQGLEQYRPFVSGYLSAFPDLHFTIEDQIAEGDKVVTRWTARGTHQGPFMGIPATGKQGTVTGITIDRFANGKIVESWYNFDALGLLQLLGAIPAPGQPG